MVAFLHGGAAVMVGSAGAGLAPALTRGFAPRVAPDRRTVDVFVGRGQSVTCLTNLAVGAPVAVIVGNPSDYRGVQVKGVTVGQRDATAADAEWLARYWRGFTEAIAAVGIPPAQSAQLWCRDMACITFTPTAIFRQTPGPGAGEPLVPGPPWT